MLRSAHNGAIESVARDCYSSLFKMNCNQRARNSVRKCRFLSCFFFFVTSRPSVGVPSSTFDMPTGRSQSPKIPKRKRDRVLSPFPTRTIEELEAQKRGLQLRSTEYDVSFRENCKKIDLSASDIRAKRSALRRVEKTFTAMAMTLDEMTAVVREEEELRALVPAGSGR